MASSQGQETRRRANEEGEAQVPYRVQHAPKMGVSSALNPAVAAAAAVVAVVVVAVVVVVVVVDVVVVAAVVAAVVVAPFLVESVAP